MNQNPLIIFSCYHKSGTTLLRNFIIDYANQHSLKWKEGHFHNLSPEDFKVIDIWFDPWGTALVPHNLEEPNREDLEEAVGRKCLGVHLIRDPKNIIVSGYLYHKSQRKESAWSGWYRDTLQSLNQDDGLLFEISRTGGETITRMNRWNYNNNLFLELRYENLITNFTSTFKQILQHINSPTPRTDLVLAERHDINRMSGKAIKENEHIISKKFDPYKWTQFFKGVHFLKFYTLFPDLQPVLNPYIFSK